MTVLLASEPENTAHENKINKVGLREGDRNLVFKRTGLKPLKTE